MTLEKKGTKKQGREGDLVGLMITDEEWFPRLLFKKNKAEAAEHEIVFLLFSSSLQLLTNYII